MDDNFDVFQTMTTTPRTFPRMDLFDVQVFYQMTKLFCVLCIL